jgi:hypothetical protein
MVKPRRKKQGSCREGLAVGKAEEPPTARDWANTQSRAVAAGGFRSFGERCLRYPLAELVDRSSSISTDPSETSLPVPEVVGIVITFVRGTPGTLALGRFAYHSTSWKRMQIWPASSRASPMKTVSASHR